MLGVILAVGSLSIRWRFESDLPRALARSAQWSALIDTRNRLSMAAGESTNTAGEIGWRAQSECATTRSRW